MLHVALIKCFKECIIFSWVNVTFTKAICFMVCTSVQKNSPIYIFCHSALLKSLSPERLVSRMKVSLPAWRLWCLWRETDLCACGLPGNTGIPDYPRLHIFQYKGYESHPVYKTKWKTLFFSSLFFFLFTPCNVSGSPFPGCWQERDSEKFLYVRCLVSPMKIPFWHTSRKVIRGALCQHGWLQQKQYPFEWLRNLWFKALSYNHI